MKTLAIASAGGHWIQLMRLLPAFKQHELIFVSTHRSFADTVKGYQFYSVPDANRWNKFKLVQMAYRVCRIILATRPGMIVSTGAAPGLMGIIVGKAMGAKTIWIDSIANVDRISLSGRIALYFADRTYTQWPHLSTNKVMFNGNVLS